MTQAASPAPDATCLRTVFESCIPPRLGFLPPVVPLDTLPAPWDDYLDAVRELPRHYHGDAASARAWMDSLFATCRPEVLPALPDLSVSERDKLMTVLSMLGHAYKWDRLPPPKEMYSIERVVLPEGLREPWKALARLLDVPRVGSTYSMGLSNWRLPGRRGGTPYAPEEVLGNKVEMAHPWLLPPQDAELRAFLVASVELEAHGGVAVDTCVEVVEAALREEDELLATLLTRLHGELERMALPMSLYVQTRKLKPETFLNLVQPHTVWGLDEGDGPLEGPSGPQFGCVQVVDATLGLKRQSYMSQASLRSRRYMPPRHRRFLAALDEVAPAVRARVEASRDARLSEPFNACCEAMHAWRHNHMKRGMLYLRHGQATNSSYVSSGLAVQVEDSRADALEKLMEERAQESRNAKVSVARPQRPE
jgi:hypothetical protein